jgi:hypothetical protein
LDDVCVVLDEHDGPGVDARETGIWGGEDCMGGGVTDTERCIVAMWMAGRARQKDDALLADDWTAGASDLEGPAMVGAASR